MGDIYGTENVSWRVGLSVKVVLWVCPHNGLVWQVEMCYCSLM